MAWLSGYSYRKKVDITGQSGAGTDYQIVLEIGDSAGGDFHLEGHCQNFPQDIRFTDDGGSTELSYWIEDETVDPITVWVKVTDNLDSDQSIYCYYGKSGDSTASDGEDTFEFFDGFDSGTEPDSDKWSTDGSPTVSDGCLILNQDGEHVYSNGSSGYTADDDRVYECSVYVDGKFSFIVIQPDYFQIYSSGSYGFTSLYWGNLYTQTGDGGRYEVDRGSHSFDVWKRLKMIFTPGKVRWEVPEGTFEHTSQVPQPDDNMHISLWAKEDGVENKVDWVLVRKYCDPSPAFSSAGAEEQESTPSGQPFVKRLGGVPFMRGQRFGVKIW